MLYKDIALEIAQMIKQEDIQGKMPTEKELVEKFSTSRNTVRAALQVLLDAGILVAKAGKGYFINDWSLEDDPTLNFNFRNSFTRQFYADDQPHSNEVLEFQEVACPPEVAKLMKIKPTEMMYLVKRHRDAGCYNENYEYSLYRQKLIPYLNEEVAANHIFSFIQDRYQVVDEHSDYYIRQSRQDNPFADVIKAPKLYVTAIHENKQEAFCYSEVYYLDETMAFYVRT
ncbi:hypothetical protein LPAF129_02800 [Ligilactobacillus pabuli]|uniref:HTH gntR-type domain-containing protein n=1 Tax=Ligilactobacillus pabuli TaxID=2886039 RepID=A0ABQ5JHW2_9LACO|nr:GntR family transcriptional regulator [Ligilactobacillus pabuli]GKS80595.1 hypothetical protein LPAF129_02800 [Ligilactobacillus pabuli]